MEEESSHKNEFEADFLLQLCQYFILQGYTSKEITILTTYSGQMLLLKEVKIFINLLNKNFNIV